MIRALMIVLAVASSTSQAEDSVVFPDSPPLRIEATVDGRSVDVAWAAFLDKLFDWFDRDGNATLSRMEASRVMPLPSADGREAKLDASKEWSRESFRTYWRGAGFAPVSLRIVKPDADAMKVGGAIAALLDRDADGKLSAEELRRIPDLLRRCDENEDEALSVRELLASIDAKPVPPAGVKLGAWPMDGSVLKLRLDGRPEFERKPRSFQMSESGASFKLPSGVCSLRIEKQPVSLLATRDFYSAQFQAIAGNKPAAKAAFEDDPAAQALAALFDFADRDGDAKLTGMELDAYFDLVEAGVNCRILLEVEDRGRNLFDHVDANGDGTLDSAELNRAARELPMQFTDGVPASFRLSAGRGAASPSFGCVPIGTVTKPRPVAARPGDQFAPRWFTAMDRNADAFLSPGEFLGRPDLFMKLDSDRDGRISLKEAVNVDRR